MGVRKRRREFRTTGSGSLARREGERRGMVRLREGFFFFFFKIVQMSA